MSKQGRRPYGKVTPHLARPFYWSLTLLLILLLPSHTSSRSASVFITDYATKHSIHDESTAIMHSVSRSTCSNNLPVLTSERLRPSFVSRILTIRGGKGGVKKANEEEEEEDEDEGDYEDEEVDLDGLGGGGAGVGSYGPIKSFTDMWQKTPLMTQIYIGSSLAVTLGSWLLNKNEWPKVLHLEWKHVFTGLQFWRPLTAFLFFGPFGLNYILTIHFVWTYMAQLEKLNYNKPEDFFMMMGFGSTVLLIGYGILGISPKFLGHNLSTFLVYIWARIFEGTDVNVMDLLVIKAELLPWFFCVQTLVLEGELPFADLLGIVVGHLYHYVSQKKILVAPKAIKELFESDSMKQRYGKFKDDFV